MKFSFGCLGAVLAPIVVMANEMEQPPIAASVAGSASASASTVLRDNILNSGPKDNLRSTSSSSSSSKVTGTPIHQHLTHRVAVRHSPNQLRNTDDEVDIDIDGKVNEEAAGTTKTASATTTAASATATTTAVAASGKEECVPPVTVADISKLDSGHLPLSSCSSKKHVCIDVKDQKEPSSSSSSTLKMKTGYCLEMVWDVPTSYSAIKGPGNEDVSSTYWGDSSSTSYAATTSFTHKEDDVLYKHHHLGEAGSAGDPTTTTTDQRSYHDDDHDHDDRMYEQDQGEYHHPTTRNLQSPPYDCNNCPSRPSVQSNNYLQLAIEKCYDDQDCPIPYKDVNINCWDVSELTNMDSAFEDQLDFNSPLGCWNTGSVTSMDKMFRKAKQFDQDINSWNTGNVEYMTSMFEDAESFNSPLNGWNTGSVTKMDRTFAKTDNFNQEINSWSTGKVMYMDEMFQFATKFNSPLGGWDTSSVETMDSMFFDAEDFNKPIDGWNIGNVESLLYTFAFAYKFNQPLDNWDTGNVISLYGTFRSALEFDQPIGDWDTQRVTEMDLLFSNYYEPESYSELTFNPFNNDINQWDTRKVTSMEMMFTYSNFNSAIGAWNVRKVVYMESMFYGAQNFNQPIGEWDTSKVAYMNYVFAGAYTYDEESEEYTYYPSIFNQPIKKWDVGNVLEMYGMFDMAIFFDQPLDKWDVQSVIDTRKMFYDAESFNQCLVTWADKTSSTVNTTFMFEYSSCPCLDDEGTDSSGECADPDNSPWCQTADICPLVEITCKDDTKAKFKVGGKKKKCKKIKVNQCDNEYPLKKVDGVNDGKPKDFCQKTCYPTECCIDDTGTEYRIETKEGNNVKGKYSCQKIKDEDHCKGKLQTGGKKLKKLCPLSCGQC